MSLSELDFITKALGPLPSSGYFTRRESEVLILLLSGESKKEVAAHLNISQKTVSTILAAAKIRVGARSAEQLVGFCATHLELLSREAIRIEPTALSVE